MPFGAHGYTNQRRRQVERVDLLRGKRQSGGEAQLRVYYRGTRSTNDSRMLRMVN